MSCSNNLGIQPSNSTTVPATKALKEGSRVYYIKIESLLNVLKTKDSLTKSKKTFDYLVQCDLIIIDDLMYIPLTGEEWTMFYKIIMFLNESRSLIFYYK